MVVAADGRFVLTARRNFKGDLHWGLPKGTIEEGETHEQAALREANEETGLTVEMVSKLNVIDYWYIQPAQGDQPSERVHKFVHFYLMRATGGDPEAHDHETEQVGFFTPDESLRQTSYSSEIEVLQAAMDILA